MEKTMKNKVLPMMVLTCLSAGAASAQQLSAARTEEAEPAVRGRGRPVAAEAMNAVQSALNGIGDVKWHETIRNGAGETLGSYDRLVGLKQINVDASACTFSAEMRN